MRAAIGEISCRPPSRESSAAGFPSVDGDGFVSAGVASGAGAPGGSDSAVADEAFAGLLSIDLSKAAMSSSASPMIAMACPSGALSPSPIRILRSTPFASACISIVALSVSISASGSPIETLSPSFFNQRESCPSSMVGESLGITTWVAI